jgi:predicted phosphate transport protein (TIGR00153 family)
MRFGLSKLFRESPFDKLQEHAEKVQAGGELFRTAIKCYLESDCVEFEELHTKVTTLESDADRIKQNIRAHLPKGILLPMDKFQFLWYLREEDKVMDAMEDALHWLSYRTTLVPEPLVDDLLLMVDKAVEVIDQLPLMVTGAVFSTSTTSPGRRETRSRTSSET